MRFIFVSLAFMSAFVLSVNFAVAQMTSIIVEKVDAPEVVMPLNVVKPAAQYIRRVTPVANCFAEMEWAEALEIRRNFTYPYTECMRRQEEKNVAQELLLKEAVKEEVLPTAEINDIMDKKEGTLKVDSVEKNHEGVSYNE